MEKVDVTKFKKIFLIYNRNSGKQIFASMMSRVNEVYKHLKSSYGSAQVELIDVQRFDELEGIGQKICAKKADWVIIAGGDGTVRKLIEIIVDGGARPYFSIFPAGTVNLVAKELQIPLDPAKWVNRSAKGILSQVYFARANGHLFLTCAGIGYDSLIVNAVSESAKKLLNKFAYVLGGAQMIRKEFLRRHWQYQFQVRSDGGEWQDASTVIVGKSRYYAGRYMIFPGAGLKNDCFHAALFTGSSSGDFVRYSALLGMEMLSSDSTVKMIKGKKLEIKCNVDDFPAELDGDIITTAPLTLEMEESPLQFIG